MRDYSDYYAIYFDGVAYSPESWIESLVLDDRKFLDNLDAYTASIIIPGNNCTLPKKTSVLLFCESQPIAGRYALGITNAWVVQVQHDRALRPEADNDHPRHMNDRPLYYRNHRGIFQKVAIDPETRYYEMIWQFKDRVEFISVNRGV